MRIHKLIDEHITHSSYPMASSLKEKLTSVSIFSFSLANPQVASTSSTSPPGALASTTYSSAPPVWPCRATVHFTPIHFFCNQRAQFIYKHPFAKYLSTISLSANLIGKILSQPFQTFQYNYLATSAYAPVGNVGLIFHRLNV